MQIIKGMTFHQDIAEYLYYADSDLKNYEYNDFFKQLKIQVISGNLQNGFNIYSQEEPSLLYTKFKIIKPDGYSGKIPYYPRYRALNPYQRYEYLSFLQNPYKKNVDYGYLLLLLYCLERRLSEGKTEVIAVMKKLADYHGGKFADAVAITMQRYQLWSEGRIYPSNSRVYHNYTLYYGCNTNQPV